MESNDVVRKSIYFQASKEVHIRDTNRLPWLADKFSSASEIVVLCDSPVASWRLLCASSPCQLTQGPCFHLNLL